MDFITVYRESFTPKISIIKPQTRRYPDYSCKECTKALRNKIENEKLDNESNTSNLGNGDKDMDKAQLRNRSNLCFCCRKEIGDGHQNRQLSADADKICDDQIDPKTCKEISLGSV